MGFRLSFSILQQLLLLVTLCTLGCTQQYCVKRERLALLDFKKSFASFSQNDGKLSSWNSSKEADNCCLWEGITCDNHASHVISLDLYGLGLVSHQLRPSLLELQHLSSLYLGGNSLAMRIPTFFGSFSKLTSLQIGDDGFFGMIPPQLGNLSNLQTLLIISNNLSTDNFQWLSHLSFLKSLHIDSMNFSEARDWLSVIRELPLLSSFECVMCYFPTPDVSSRAYTHHVNSSSSLQTLYIGGGYMSSHTLSLLVSNTSSLLEVELDFLKLDVPMPSVFHHMISLQSLHLKRINLEVGIFHSIGNLCNLRELIASGCVIKESISDIFQALSGCASTSLESIYFEANSLTGTIPPMLKFQSLSSVSLNHNLLASLPNTLPLFPASLTTLSLDNNSLNGVLSDLHFTNSSHLTYLSLSHNANLTISFNKPLTEVGYLDLSSCNLGPNFPSWLLVPNKISRLDISHSKLSDTIPVLFWWNLSPNLTYLDLSYNNLYGTVPKRPFRFSSSDLVIDMSSNALSGPIPFVFFMANALYLSHNNFSGFAPIIPHHYNVLGYKSSDPYLVPPNIVDLSNNLLSGPIPQWLGLRFPNLAALILAYNNLSGTIPISIGNSTGLYVLNLRNNRFSGPLPSVLKKFHKLSILDLSANRFSGFIPSWVGKSMKQLIVFSLGSNNLSGILPPSLCHLSYLQILDMSHNTLSGNIPKCIHDFNAMGRDVESNEQVDIQEIDDIYGEQLEDALYFNAYINWKNKVWQFQSSLKYVKLIDLSSNNFSGEIPTGLTSLVEIDSVDLSGNNLQGSIPEQIGQLKSLQFLDLSRNRLSGQIPSSLSEISSLEMLDLSHNNLSGRIPSGTQLGGFNATAYSANPYLCGMPLNKCPGDKDDSAQALQPSPSDGGQMEDKWPDEQCFFAGLGTGFAFGFLGILASLTWIKKWRYAFFKFAAQFGEWILLVVALNMPKISRKLRLK